MISILRFLFGAIAFCAVAVAQDANENFPTSDEIRAELSAQQKKLDELRAAFADADETDIAALRVTIGSEREKLAEVLATLQEKADALDIGEAETAPSDQDSAPEADDAEGLDQPRATVEQQVSRAETILRGLDALASEVMEREQIITAQENVDRRRAEIDAATQRLAEASSQQALVTLREELRALRLAAAEEIETIRQSQERLRKDLERLGEPPEAGMREEAPEIAEERNALQALLVKEEAIVRQWARNDGDIDRLIADIAVIRRDLFYGEVLSRGPSPLSPAVTKAASTNFIQGVTILKTKAEDWAAIRQESGTLAQSFILLGLAALAGFILFFPTRRWINKQLVGRLQSFEPTPGRRAWVALLRILTRTLPGVLAGLVVLEVLSSQGIVDDTTKMLAGRMWFGLLAVIIAEGAATAILSPGVPGWRLLPLERGSGRLLKTLSIAMVTVFVADGALGKGAEVFGGGQELALVQSALVACLMGGLAFLLTAKKVWQLDSNRGDAFSEETKQVGTWLRMGIRALAILSIIAALTGYVALAYFIPTRIFMISGLVIAALFLRLIAQETLRILDRAGNNVPSNEDQPQEEERLIFFWLGVVIDLIVVALFLPPVAVVLGAEWVDVRNAVRDAFFGFKIGEVTISIAQILAAVGTFVLILLLTRFLQRMGEKRFFPRTRLDVGVQNSLKTMIGYTGLVIAIMAAVSVIGFDLSSLAIIAGALSVGIGFGLQSIVNNFVSGLILLFERPVKVGDWIVVSSGEGTVKRISVRSTEIETWDRSSIIVPNSELISSSVTNWTLKDRWTRVIVQVGVSYDADPAKVLEILQGVVRDNPKTMRFPEPFIFFGGFGDSSLDFEIRAFVRETSERLVVQNELRIATFSALKKANIEIPFPQRDLHIKSGPSPAEQALPTINDRAAPSTGT